MRSEKEVLSAIAKDDWMLEVLRAAETLNLPDWWICAGFVRAKVWDLLHNYAKRTPLADIDVIYFDKENLDENMEKEYERQLKLLMPGLPWSVKNQARMHLINDLPPYLSSSDAISQFPETATALGLKLEGSGKLKLIAPYGLNDLLTLQLCPTPAFKKSDRLMGIYRQRLLTKEWTKKWPQVNALSVTEDDKRGIP